MTDVEILSQRLAKVERRFRLMTRAATAGGIFIIAAAMAAGVTAQVRGPVRPGEVLPNGRIVGMEKPAAVTAVEAEVRARHFVLVDENNKERASLVADGAGSVFLVMFDSAGKTRANL